MFEVTMNYARFSSLSPDGRRAYLGVLAANYQSIIASGFYARSPIYEVDRPDGERREFVQLPKDGIYIDVDGSVHQSTLESRARWLSSSSRLVDLLDEAERNEPDMNIRETVKDLYGKVIEFGESLKKI